MLDSADLERIEYQAINDYISEKIYTKDYRGETIRGDYQKWTDADDYYTVPGVCYITGETIKDWLIDRFESAIEEFLNVDNAQAISDLARDTDLYDEESYYQYVYDICDSVEDYFWESDLFQELCNDYYEEHAEEDYD